MKDGLNCAVGTPKRGVEDTYFATVRSGDLIAELTERRSFR